MNAIALVPVAAPQPLLSAGARIAAAIAVAGFVAAAWASAGQSSEQAVQLSTAALNRTHVTLPTVEIVARRDGAAELVAARAARSGSL